MNKFDIKTPHVVECNFFSSFGASFKQSVRVVANYELDYNISGGRIMTVNDKSYKIEKNSLVFRKPGEVVKSKGKYNMYALTFSFDKSIKNYSRNSAGRPSYTASDIQLLNHLPTYIRPHHTGEIIEVYKQLLSYFGPEFNDEVCSQLVTKLIYLTAVEASSVSISSYTPYNAKVNEIIAYISEHYGEQINLDMIADYVHLDKSYLIRCFKKSIGKTPVEYLIEKRIEIAKSLLADTKLNISEIANLCGFSDASYFTLKFRSIVGVTPTIFRKNGCD